MGYFIDLEACGRISPMPGIETTILSGMSGEKTMIVLTSIDAGVTVQSHSHPHEQIGIVYSGTASMRIGDDERIVKEKDLYFVPPDVDHEATAQGTEPFVVFEVFSPVREDFIEALKKKR